MKRDMDLIRKILLTMEDAPHGYAPNQLIIDGYTDDEIGHHCYLLLQSGLAEGTDWTAMNSPSPVAMLTTLTWEGHEFIAAARDESRWKDAKKIINEKGGALTLGVITQVLGALARAPLGL